MGARVLNTEMVKETVQSKGNVMLFNQVFCGTVGFILWIVGFVGLRLFNPIWTVVGIMWIVAMGVAIALYKKKLSRTIAEIEGNLFDVVCAPLLDKITDYGDDKRPYVLEFWCGEKYGNVKLSVNKGLYRRTKAEDEFYLVITRSYADKCLANCGFRKGRYQLASDLEDNLVTVTEDEYRAKRSQVDQRLEYYEDIEKQLSTMSEQQRGQLMAGGKRILVAKLTFFILTGLAVVLGIAAWVSFGPWMTVLFAMVAVIAAAAAINWLCTVRVERKLSYYTRDRYEILKRMD